MNTNVKRGVLVGGFVCFLLGSALPCFLLERDVHVVSTFLFIASFVLSIVAIVLGRLEGGVLLLLLSIVIPPILFASLSDLSRQAKAPKAPPCGSWRSYSFTDPIDDSTIFVLSIDAEETFGLGFMSSTPTLMITRRKGELNVLIEFYKHLGNAGKDVTLRLGEFPATHEEWSLSADAKSIIYPHDAQVFIAQLRQNDRLIVRLTPTGENQVTAIFNLWGLAGAMLVEPEKLR